MIQSQKRASAHALFTPKHACREIFVALFFALCFTLPQVGFSADFQIANYPVHTFLGPSKLQEDLTYITFSGDFGFRITALGKRDVINRFVESQRQLLSNFSYNIGNLEFGLHGATDNVQIRELDNLKLQTLVALELDAVSLANNHSLDYGPDALSYGSEQLEAHGLSWFGTKSQPFHSFEINAIRIAVFGITDGLDKPDATNVIMKMEQSDIDYYRKHASQYDVTIAFIHLGSGSRYQSPHEANQVHLLQDLGFTVVVCTGSHYVKGAYLRNDRPIILGTGNHLLESNAYFTEFIGSHVVFGLKKNKVEQIFIIPFKNDIYKGVTGPLNKAEFEDFLVNFEDWSDSTTSKYYQDDLLFGSMKNMIRSHGVNIFSELKFRHIVYGVKVLYSNFTFLFVLATVLAIGIAYYISTALMRMIGRYSQKICK